MKNVLAPWRGGLESIGWKPVIPFAIMTLLSAATIGALVVIAANGQDRVAKTNSIDVLGAVLAQTRRQLEMTTGDYGYWDEAVANLVNTVDLDWADTNIGFYLYDTADIHSSYVLDGSNRVAYASVARERLLDDPTESLSGGFQSFLNQARTNALPGKKPEVTTAFFRDEDTVLLAAAVALTTYESDSVADYLSAKPTDTVLVLTKHIDDVLLQNIGDSYGLLDLRLELEPASSTSERISLSLPLSNGQFAGFLTWQASSPGRITLSWLLPLVLIVFFLLAAIAAVFFHQTRKVVSALSAESKLALQESEARLSTILDNIPASVVLKDTEGRYLLINREFEKRHGLASNDMLGRTNQDIRSLSQDQANQITDSFREVVGTARAITNEMELSLPEGELRIASVTQFPIIGSLGEITSVGAISTDITERKRQEDKLREADKLSALGEVVGGVAHEFNNMLQAISANLELVAAQLSRKQGTQDLVKRVRSAIGVTLRGGRLTGQLLSYTGKHLTSPEDTDVTTLVSDSVSLLRPMLGETVEIATEVDDNLWLIQIDRGQLEAVLFNLAVNARDAMDGDGKIVIGASNVVLDDEFVAAHRAHNVRPGKFVMVAVRDSGSGMLPEVMEKAFDPFFTTKGLGKGTGLGLSVVYGFVVRQSRGFVWIESEPDAGATVQLYFPVVESTMETVGQA